jgi:hypothetical protein
VTRLGEFSPIGRLFYLGQFFETYLQEKSKRLGKVYPPHKFCINFDNKFVGLDFGRFFFQNSSGHPDGASRASMHNAFLGGSAVSRN